MTPLALAATGPVVRAAPVDEGGPGTPRAAAHRRSALARDLLRDTIVGVRADLDRDGVELRSEPSGRLLVIDHPEVAVSISHTRGLVAVAVSTAGPVGIDVEPLERAELPSPEAWLTARELACLDRLEPDRRRLALLRAWVAKEATIKARAHLGVVTRCGLQVDGPGERGLVRAAGTREQLLAALTWHTLADRFLVAVARPAG